MNRKIIKVLFRISVYTILINLAKASNIKDSSEIPVGTPSSNLHENTKSEFSSPTTNIPSTLEVEGIVNYHSKHVVNQQILIHYLISMH